MSERIVLRSGPIRILSARARDEGIDPLPDGSDHPHGSARDRRCVLVVDDEPDSVELLVELVESEGFRAMGAANGAEALSILRSGERPRLILLDLNMPVMDGWEFLRLVYEDQRLNEIPIAIVTGAVPATLPRRRRDAGLFVKPIDVDHLLATLRKTCE